MVETEDLSLVAHPGDVGGPARVASAPRGALPARHAGLPDPPDTLVTTLLDAEVYRVADLAELYRQRWQVETSLAHLKTTMRMDVLHCKTVPGVLKELTVFAIVYNLVRWSCGNQRPSNTPPWSGSASWMPCGGSARQYGDATQWR